MSEATVTPLAPDPCLVSLKADNGSVLYEGDWQVARNCPLGCGSVCEKTRAEAQFYQARDPSLVEVLEHFGLISAERAAENEARWQIEMDHVEELRDLSLTEWKKRPWWRRLGIGGKA